MLKFTTYTPKHPEIGAIQVRPDNINEALDTLDGRAYKEHHGKGIIVNTNYNYDKYRLASFGDYIIVNDRGIFSVVQGFFFEKEHLKLDDAPK